MAGKEYEIEQDCARGLSGMGKAVEIVESDCAKGTQGVGNVVQTVEDDCAKGLNCTADIKEDTVQTTPPTQDARSLTTGGLVRSEVILPA